MEDRTIDILGLNETRLENTISDSQIDIEGYDILRRDRNRNGGGGGGSFLCCTILNLS